MPALHPPLVASCAALERRLRAEVRRTLAVATAGPSAGLIVACSGGPDSVALLQATAGVRAADQRVIAAYVDHRLRPGTAAEAALVEGHALRLGVEFAGLMVRAAGKGTRGRSPEEAARTARYRALARLARQERCGVVLVAHTRRDLAETVLLRLLQGAGPAGLAAMAAVSAWPLPGAGRGLLLLRPFLAVGREEIEALVSARRLAVVTDPSNEDPRFLRNRIRRELVPVLARLQPAVEERLCQLAHLAGAERAVQQQLLDAELGRRRLRRAGAGVLLALDLRAADLPLRLALLHRAMSRVEGGTLTRAVATRPGFAKLRQAVTGGQTDLGGGLRATFTGGTLRVLRPDRRS